MAALKNIFRSRKTEDTDENTSPGAEDHVTEDGAGARSLRFAGPEDETDVPKSKGGGIKFAEPPPPDSKDSKKGKKNKPKHVRVVIEDDTEGSSKKTKKAAGKSKSQPPPTVSPHTHTHTHTS